MAWPDCQAAWRSGWCVGMPGAALVDTNKRPLARERRVQPALREGRLAVKLLGGSISTSPLSPKLRP